MSKSKTSSTKSSPIGLEINNFGLGWVIDQCNDDLQTKTYNLELQDEFLCNLCKLIYP